MKRQEKDLMGAIIVTAVLSLGIILMCWKIVSLINQNNNLKSQIEMQDTVIHILESDLSNYEN
jgi:cell division protein FtsL